MGDEQAVVLVVNEESADPEKPIEWRDVYGARYHFPNQYKSKITASRRFVYYRGVRRKDGSRGDPEYLGTGRIAQIDPDPETAAKPAGRRAFFALLSDYVEFPAPVPAKTADGWIESTVPKNQIGYPRRLSEENYSEILRRAGANDDVCQPSDPAPVPQPFPPVASITSADVFRVREKPASISVPRSQHVRRSRAAKAIGDRAERIVFELLRREFETVRWHAAAGETPGYDLSYTKDQTHIVVEVKGTTGDSITTFELTERELAAARSFGDAFHLYLVAECGSATPIVQVIPNPVDYFEARGLLPRPVLFRIGGN